jgi:hypothetical protein
LWHAREETRVDIESRAEEGHVGAEGPREACFEHSMSMVVHEDGSEWNESRTEEWGEIQVGRER